LSEGQELSRLDRVAIAISPDGSNVIYNANDQLYLRSLDEIEVRPLDGTREATNVFFSPDGKWFGFVANRKLQKAPIGGGAPVVLCDATDGVSGASWGDDGTILFAEILRGIYRVPDSGGEAKQIVAVEQGRFPNGPLMLPGSRAFLYALGGLDYDADSQIFLQSFQTGEKRVLFQPGTDVRYLQTGHLVYIRGGELLAAPFDLDRHEVLSTPIPVAENVMHDPMGNGAAQFSVSDDGTLVTISGVARRRLVWMDRRGQFEPLSLPESTYLGPALSPNGRQVAMMIREQAGTNVWVYDLEREALTKLTFTGDNFWPIWSSDGKRVLFGHYEPIKGEPGIFSVPADGGLPPERLTTADSIQNPSGYSPDGLVFAITSLSPTWDILVLRAGESSPEPFLNTPFEEFDARFSPDGRWIAHTSNESGRREVYVRSFPEGSDRQQISTNGGDQAMWNPKGGELFYKEGNRMMAVDVETGSGAFRASKPRVLYERRFLPGINGPDRFAVSPDGQRFLLTAPSENAPASGQINIVVNWLEVVRQRTGTVK
jgi:serine/threonine-protein kinase